MNAFSHAGIAVTLSAAIAACSGGTFKRTQLGNEQLLSIDATQRIIYSGVGPDGQQIICAEPSPDAIAAVAAAFAARADVPIGGTSAVKAGLGASFSESVASIGLRTQTIQVMRDGYYRLCEAFKNGAIEADDYKRILGGIDTFLIAMIAIDTIGGSKAAPLIGIGGVSKTTTTAEGTSTETTITPEKLAEAVKAQDSSLSDAQVAGIVEIAITYLARDKKSN